MASFRYWPRSWGSGCWAGWAAQDADHRAGGDHHGTVADRLLLADPAGRVRPGLRHPGTHCDVPGLPTGRNFPGHLADALGNLPAEDPRPGHGGLGLPAVDRELPDRIRIPAA